MARLDQVITNIVDVFLEYAEDEGKKHQLNKEEFKKVLEQEIQSPELKVRDSTHSLYVICTSIHKMIFCFSFTTQVCFCALHAAYCI